MSCQQNQQQCQPPPKCPPKCPPVSSCCSVSSGGGCGVGSGGGCPSHHRCHLFHRRRHQSPDCCEPEPSGGPGCCEGSGGCC